MSTRKSYDIRSIELTSGYSFALPGRIFTAFVSDANECIYYPREDKDRISYLYEVYQRRIRKMSHYDIIIQGNKNRVTGESPEALSYFMGLPKASMSKVDMTKPIADQLAYLNIEEELIDKFTVISTYVPNDDEKANNFRIYAEETFKDNLSHGIYIDVDGEARNLKIIGPVDFDIVRLYQEDRDLINTFNADRILIDFAYVSKKTPLDETRKLLTMLNPCRIDSVYNYLYGYEENEYISGLRFNGFQKELLRNIYTELVKSIFLFTYDRLCYAKHSLESNISYLTRGMRSFNFAYTSSSFNADMYSDDNLTFYFDIQDKVRLLKLEELLCPDKNENSAVRYAKLALPCEGYPHIKKLGLLKGESIVENLLYTDRVTNEDYYAASKRESGIYSFNAGDERHDYPLYRRYLLTQGIDLTLEDTETDISLMRCSMKVYDVERDDETIATLLSKDGLLLSEKLYRAYLLSQAIPSDGYLEHCLKIIDDKYEGKANLAFFSDFESMNVNQRVDVLLQDTEIYPADSIYDFFSYLFDRLLSAADTLVRKDMIENNNVRSLTLLDKLGPQQVVYEPKLPLPYVVSGTGYYGFSSSPAGPFFLCQCQKESLKVHIRMLANQYLGFYSKQDDDAKMRQETNKYIVENLGLPDAISNDLDLNKDLMEQLRFEERICHVCNSSHPVYHHQIFTNPIGTYSSYLHYIGSNAIRHGINTSGFNIYDDVSRYGSLSRYLSQFHFTYDESAIDSKMRSYVDLNITKAAAILSCHYPTVTEAYFRSFAAISNLSDRTLKDIVFSRSDPKIRRNQLYGCQPMLALLWDYYRKLGYAYTFIYGEEVVHKIPDTVYRGYLYDERFPLPYIYLGRVFNAYSDHEKGDFYFCSCDKESMKASIAYHLQDTQRHFSKDVVTAVTLGLSGFPEEFVLRYSYYNLTPNNIDEFVDSLSFKDGICHRCQKHSLPALSTPFFIYLPRKRSARAEISNSENLILKDGLIIEKPILYGQYRYNPDIRFDLNDHINNEIPFVVKLGSNTPDLFLKVLRPDKLTFEKFCESFSRRNRRDEDTINAVKIIKETYKDDPNIFIDLFTYPNRESSSAVTLESKFPALQNFYDPSKKYRTEEKILGFLYMMFENIFDEYAKKERSLTDE